MKRWALVVVALYLLILVVLTVPVALLAFAPQARVKDVAILLFSYGPAVFFMYVARWRRLHPETADDTEESA